MQSHEIKLLAFLLLERLRFLLPKELLKTSFYLDLGSLQKSPLLLGFLVLR